ncbi:tensin-2-like isoform X1 [Cyprinodon tularosa]|uniref:tensin-2-like isoform X1 n=2 Tax=Cyprinodon tularosa TaxID=77115 RepID=UPI0018E24DC3|nr:tensin-2-like isoform X1 [Cyprinodon tularosa]
MGCMHSSGKIKEDRPGTDTEGIPVKADGEVHPEIIQLAELNKPAGHIFTVKSFKKRRACDVCEKNIEDPGAFCKECKIAVHKMCEAKVFTTCTPVPDLHSSTKSTSQKKRSSLPRRKSVEEVMEHVMEGHYDFDLTYITERIISVFFVPDLEEQRYRRNLQEVASMLKSKHQDKFLLLNLSEKRHDITRLNSKVQDYGWPDLHAPPLDRICAICKAMEMWLTSDPHNVVVLHCKGHKGKTGVIVAAYMHYSKISAGADQALTTLAMRKFCEDKISSSLHPSQSRYIYYFSGLLSGTIKMNSSPLFLHQILVPSLPNFQSGGGFYPFLKIYQSLQLIYTSGVYDPQSSRARKLCVTMEPALLLKGDIMVKCYHRRSRAAEREVVFRVQFHTCTVHGAQLWFGKTELDLACSDDRFPPDATVEFIFANSPEKLKGREYRKNDSSVKVDYKTSDPVVKWDSYENFNLHHEDSMENIAHTRGPLDGSLYAQVRKRRGPGATSSAASPNGCLTSSPTVKPQFASKPQPFTFNCSPRSSVVSSDKLSETSMSISCSEKEKPDCTLRRGEMGERTQEKRRDKAKDRETAILDDGDPSSPGVVRRERSCCDRAVQKCSDAEWERERDPCLSDGRSLRHCSSMKKHPKSQTLPALLSKSMSPPPHSAIRELCHRHSADPVAELTWDRPIHPPSLPCINRPCYPYPTPEHTLPHNHTLPASNRCYPGEECHLLLYPSHGLGSHPSFPPQPGNPYRELFISSPSSSSFCHCQDCSRRREHQSNSVKVFQQMQSDQAENPHWSQGTGGQRSREIPPLWETEKPWEMTRQAELWQCKSPLPAFHLFHSAVDQVSNPEKPRFAYAQHQNHPIPQSLMDIRDGVSSGYHTPLQPRHSCPCSPFQSSPSDSRGYASGYHSGSASPLPASSPSPGGGRLPDIPSGSRDQPHTEQHKVEKDKTVAEDDICQGSESKLDVCRESNTPGADSDHDYTVIGSSSPTHTEDSAIADSPVQSQETVTHLDSNKNTGQSVTLTPSEKQTQNLTISANPSKPPGESLLKGESELGAAEIKSSDQKTKSTVSNYATVIIPQVQVQLNGTTLPINVASECNTGGNMNPSRSSSTSSPHTPTGSPDKQSSPQHSMSDKDTTGQRLIPDRDISTDTKPPSPVPDGYHTPTFPLASYYYSLLNVPHVPYTGYTAVTIPTIQPPLPEKKRFSSAVVSPNGHTGLLQAPSCPSPIHHVTFAPVVGEHRMESAQQSHTEETETRVNSRFVQDSSKYWYKPGISRDQAIAALKDKEPGAFLIRDSNSFHGAYGLALKVATPPPNANITGNKGDPLEQLVRHFLIETGPRGVKIKGCQNESYFGSLSALVYQHSITPISLPCALRIPDKDLVGELQEMQSATNTSTAADLLKQGAACNVLYLNSVETESLTGPEAVSKAIKCTMALNTRPVPTVVHFKVSSQGITLTDNKRRLFFRRHYPINSVTFSSLDPHDQRWINSDSTSSKMFGFVARRTGTTTENVCHLFAEMDPEQPAVAIVNFINKVMLGPQLRR